MDIPGLGIIPPLEFISLSEKRMLMYDLGNLILRRSCDFLNLLKNSGFENIGVAVNISGIQLLRDEFNDDIGKIVDETGINIGLLEFEITESLLIDNFDQMNQTLKEIKEQGITISLDDFGTGFSSFARLRDLNIDSIKIDKYFIDKIAVTEEASLISADIISMAHKIGLSVVAEGVENEMQKDYLAKSNCDIIQGYLISRPLDQDEAIRFLEGR
jgi:EAL domain-containing protein (putative c-di-GMP-specific phosphodiesterase class I)